MDLDPYLPGTHQRVAVGSDYLLTHPQSPWPDTESAHL